MIDISHESLMRIWKRLEGWVEEEAQSARIYTRLAESAVLEAAGRTGLLGDPELEIAQTWRKSFQPTAAWAARYHDGFERALDFLERSHDAKRAAEREREAQRQRELEQARALADAQRLRAEEQQRSARRLRFLLAAAAAIALVAVASSIVAVRSSRVARRAELAAARQLYIADMNLAAQAWEDGDIRRIKRQLEKHRPRAGEPDLREFEWYHWWESSHLPQGSFRHPYLGPYVDLEVTPDGMGVVAKGESGVVDFFDARARRLVNRTGVDSGEHYGLAISPTGHAAIATADRTVLFYNLDTWNVDLVLPAIGHPGLDRSARIQPAVSPVERLSVTGDRLGRIVFWTDAGLDRLAIGGPVRKLLFTPDGRRVLAAMGRLLDVDLTPMEGPVVPMQGLVVLDVDSRSVLQTLPTDFTVRAMAISPDGSRVATTGGDTSDVALWRFAPEGLVRDSLLEVDGRVAALAFSPDGSRLAAGTGRTRRVDVWDLTPEPRHFSTLRGHSMDVRAVTFVGDADTLWSTGNDGMIRTWNLRKASRFERLQGAASPNWVSFAGSLAYSADGLSLYHRDPEGRLKLQEIGGGSSDFDAEHRYIEFAASRDGSVLAGITAEGRLRVLDPRGDLLYPEVEIFDPDTPEAEACRAEGLPGCLRGFDVGDGSSRVAWTISSAGDEGFPRPRDPREGVYIRDFATGDQRQIEQGTERSLAAAAPSFAADGRTLTARLWDKTFVWDLQSNPAGPPRTLQGWGGETKAAHSPDGELVAIGSMDLSIRLHAAADGALVARLRGHTAIVYAVDFSPDGRSLVSGGSDRTVRIWDVQTGQVRTTLRGHEAEVVEVAFAPDGRSVASRDRNGEIRIWLTPRGSTTTDEVEDRLDEVQEGDNEERFERLTEDFPDSPAAFWNRGMFLAYSGRMEEALEDLRRAGDVGAEGERFLADRVTVSSSLGDWPAAIADLARLIELSGGREADYFLLSAHALARDGRMTEAFGHARQALALQPTPHTVEQIQRALRLGALVSTAQRDPAAYAIALMPGDGAFNYGLADGAPEPVEWRYTKSPPGDAWREAEGFDDSDWQAGDGPFGSQRPDKVIGTPWERSEGPIRLRHVFELTDTDGNDLSVPLRIIGRTLSTTPASVFLNGEPLAEVPLRGLNHYLSPQVEPTVQLRSGTHVLSVEVGEGNTHNFIDVGLYRSFSVEELAARLEQGP